MNTTLASMRVLSGDPIREAFTDQTHAHLERFRSEMRAVHGTEVEETPILMASDILLATQYDRASWDAFDVEAYFELVTAMGFGSYLSRFKVTIVAFLEFLARSGVTSTETADRVRHKSLPPPPPAMNRAERRWAARMARRRR